MVRISALILLISTLLPNLLKGQSPDFFNNTDFRVTPLSSINTNESEISPFFVKNDLFFSAVREEFFGDEERQQTNTLFYDIYRTEIDEKGNPVTARELVSGFGNMFHEGPASWCQKTGELFVTVSNATVNSRPKSKNTRNIQLRLVIMKLIEGKWVVTYDLPFNNDEFNFAHPAINKTGDTLVFSSDMEGGYGNSDLYMSLRKEGQWSTPVNLGKRINSVGNEMFPTFGPGGMLLFSSDGQEPNYGQLDIYYTGLSSLTKPVNLGGKINSSLDDFSLVIHQSGKFGYFSSNRYGLRNDDIYLVEFSPLMGNIRGQVVANHNGEPVQDALIYLEDCEGNKISSVLSGYFGNFKFEAPQGFCYQLYAAKEGYSSNLVPNRGSGIIELRLKQIINYQIVVKDFENGSSLSEAEISCGKLQWESDSAGKINVTFDSIFDCPVTVSKQGFFDSTFDLNPERFVPGAEITDTVHLFRNEAGRVFPLKFIAYYKDLWRLMPQSEPELNQLALLMENNPTLKVEINSHTDSRQEDNYSMWLSQKRADSVLEYLVQKGIAKERIVAKGYGETRLLNHCANGVACSEKQHLVNRRTEFVILEN